MTKKSQNWLNEELFDAIDGISDYDIEDLLNRGADVNFRGENGLTPLLYALQEDAFVWDIETLLEHGADTTLCDEEGRTAAMLAAYGDDEEILEQIIRLPEDLLARDNEGKGILAYAVLRDEIAPEKTACLHFLLRQGINLNTQDDNGWTALHHAAATRNRAAVYHLLKAGAKPDIPEKKCGHTPLITAVCENHAGCVKLLLQGGANPEQTDLLDCTALEYAAQNNLLESLRLLLASGLMKPRSIEKALYTAAEEGQAEALRMLLAQHGTTDLRTEMGLTLLGAAARSGSEECLDLLLTQGCQLNELDDHGLSALDHAYQAGRSHLAHKLLQLGARPSREGKMLTALADVTEMDFSEVPGGCTPLMHTAACGLSEQMKKLLNDGAIVHETNDFGLTALHLAVFHGQTECTRLLLEHGARIPQPTAFTPGILDSAAERGYAGCLRLLLTHLPQKRKELNRLLLLAAGKGSIECIDFLLQKGAQINAKDDDKLTPLHHAAKAGRVHCLRYMIEQGAKLNATTDDGSTALHLAAAQGQQEMVRCLLELGFPVDAESTYYTPLMQAAMAGHVDCVKLLLEHGANPDAKDSERWTVLHFAAECTTPECVRALLEAGAKPNVRCAAKFTPIMRAVDNNRPDIVQLLLEYGAHPHTPNLIGRSPLVEAIYMGYTECAELLIDAKPPQKERKRYLTEALNAAEQQGLALLAARIKAHLA